MQKILVLNGSYNEIPVIQLLKTLGYYVITTGNDPSLQGHKESDEYIYGDYSDAHAMLQIVQKHDIFRVIPCANDFGAITASYIAEHVGWSGYDTYDNMLILHHKDLFKKYCSNHKIPSVYSEVFTDLPNLIKRLTACTYPIMVKANDLTGGKGITKALNYKEAVAAAKYAFTMSKDKTVVIEPYIDGKQYTIETFIQNHKVICSTGCNCYSKVNPYLIQTETYPSDELAVDSQIIIPIVEALSKDLNLVDGVLTVQYKKEHGEIYVIEMMRRLLGNQSFSICEKVTGFPWYYSMLSVMLNRPDIAPKRNLPYAIYYGHHGVFALSNGIYQSYVIPAELQEHVEYIVNLINPGTEITDYKTQRIASIYYKFDTKEEMERVLDDAYKTVAVYMR